MGRVACIVLGGGQGTRLFPLTSSRCKPAICFGGSYRLIDIPLANAIHSRCQRIFVLTQFLSASLHRHIFSTYSRSPYSSGFIELLAAEQRPETPKSWYEGTADAVRKNLDYFFECPADYFLILSGDQLYSMDFEKMVGFAIERCADLTIATLAVPRKDIHRMGVLKVDDESKVTGFFEKPTDAHTIEELAIPNGNNPLTDPDARWWGSMGIYVIRRETLWNMLKNDLRDDFGKHLIPKMVSEGGVYAFQHEGYWEDIGTIESFYEANLALVDPHPPFDPFDIDHCLYREPHHLPSSRLIDCQLDRVLIGEATQLTGCKITHSIIGTRTLIGEGTTVKDSYIMGSDIYRSPASAHIPSSIGKNCLIERAILDINVTIGDNVRLVNHEGLTSFDSHSVYIRDGIIVVKRGSRIPDGFTL